VILQRFYNDKAMTKQTNQYNSNSQCIQHHSNCGGGTKQ